MKRLIISSLIFGLSIVFLSCSEKIPSAPLETDEQAASVLMKEGTEIFRYSSENWFSIIDWDAGLRVHFGFPDMNICASDLEIFDFKDKILPNNDPEAWDRIMTLVKGKGVTAHVREYPPDYNVYPTNCDYYAAVPPIASGTVNLMYKDNDVNAWARDANTNVFSLKAQGKLYGPDGQKYNLNASYKAIFKGYFEPPDYVVYVEQFFKESSEIKLH